MGKQADSIARVLGKSYAYLQDGMDRVIAYGFERMRDANEQQPKKTKPQKPTTILGHVGQAARSMVGFFGTAGDSYYRTYDDLKRRRPNQD
jgi:hypothetical protein